jgi:hypothetical protein
MGCTSLHADFADSFEIPVPLFKFFQVTVHENLQFIDSAVLAAGKTQKEVERIMKSLLPPEKIKLVYIFQLKTK